MKEREDKAQSSLDAEPNQIKSRHRALMRRLIAGMTLSQACEDIGFTVSRASIIVNSPLFIAEKEKMEADLNEGFVSAEAERSTLKVESADPARQTLSDSAEKAARTLKGALDAENPLVAMSAAKDILDRTGYAKEDKIKAKVVVEPSQSLIDVIGRINEERSEE